MKSVDGVLYEWDDIVGLGWRRTIPRVFNMKKGLVPSEPSSLGSGKRSVNSIKEKIVRIARKSPEVMVKISGNGKNIGQVKAHIDYISRFGEVRLEDETGRTYDGSHDVEDFKEGWKYSGIGIPETGSRRETFNIILSMPAGTNEAAVKAAARQFSRDLFENYEYVFAAHSDEPHPHVHLCVKALSLDGVRLNPRKKDLQEWREVFAEKLREQGVDANATPRKARGVIDKFRKQASLNIDERFKAGKLANPSYYTQKKNSDHVNEDAVQKIQRNRKQIITGYGQIAVALAQSDLQNNKDLAKQLVELVSAMPIMGSKIIDSSKPKSGGKTLEVENGVLPRGKEQGRG